MKVFGTLREADEDVKIKVRKGTEFPDDAQPADLFTLINNGQEIPYIRKSTGWCKLIVEGENIDAGTY